jgi:hypothetical protein
MYINRKTGERVEVIELKNYNEQGIGLISYGVYNSTGYIEYSDADFREQYGEAMIMPQNVGAGVNIHPKMKKA